MSFIKSKQTVVLAGFIMVLGVAFAPSTSIAAAPSAITDLSGNKGNTQVRLLWTAPSNGGSAITDYVVEYKLSSDSSWTTFADGTSTTASALVTGLTNGSAYDFKVKAVNADGTAADSNTATVTPALATGTPSTVSDLSLWLDASDSSTMYLSGGSNVLRWYDKSGNARTAHAASSTHMPTVVSNAQNGLSAVRFNGTTNYLTISNAITYKTVFVVAKFNGTQFSDFNGLIGDVTGGSPNAGHFLNGRPSTTLMDRAGFTFTTVYRNGSLLSYSSGGYNFSPINQYWIGEFILNSGQTNNQTSLGRLADGLRIWNGDMLEVINYDRVLTSSERLAVEQYLGNKWNIAVPQPPSAITDLSASVAKGERVGLSWSAATVANGTLSDYIIDYRLSGNSTWTTFADGTSTSTQATVTGLMNGSMYEFRVRGVSEAGTAADSNIVSATPVAGLIITSPVRQVAGAGLTATRALSNRGGTFYIPYIQTSTSLSVAASDNGSVPTGGGIKFVLSGALGGSQTVYDMASPYTASFTGLAKDDYTLDAYVVNSGQTVQSGNGKYDQAIHIGIGDIFVSIGDSITEGIGGDTYAGPVNSWINSPTGTVSNDGRNFALYGWTNNFYMPSWQPTFNSYQGSYAQYPVFVMNEGVGGYRTSDYLALMGSVAWQNRQTSLQPNKWTIHLGVNDANQSVGASTYQTNLQSIVNTLINSHGANPTNIYIARPMYETFVTSAYATAADTVTSLTQASAGPDFWNFFRTHSSLYNAQDTVHPNASGYIQMGRLFSLSAISPKNVSASQSGGDVQISWSSLASAQPTIAGYKVHYGTSSSNLNSIVDVGNATSTTISGLNSGQTYYFAVSAYDNDSSWTSGTARSSIVSVSIDTTAPVISSVSASASNTGATVTWTTDEAASSQVNYGTTASYGSSTSEADTSPRVTSHSVSLSGLTACTTYHYQVYSRDTALNAATGSDATFTTTGCDSTGPIISSVGATAGDTTATVTWTTDEAASSQVNYGTTVSYGTSTSETDTSPRVTTHSVSLSGLVVCTTYHYQVYSRDANLNATSGSDATFTTTGCDTTGPAISSVSATASDTTATVTWTTDEAASSQVNYGTTASYGSSTSEADTSPRVTSHSVSLSGLTACTTYHYQVYSRDANLNATTSGDATFMTSGCDTTAPVISSVSASASNTGATVTWTTGEASSSIVDYGFTNSYSTSTSEADTSPRVTSHSVTISNLVSCTTYHYRVRSRDASANAGTGSDNTFTTTGCAGSSSVVSEDQEEIAAASGGTVTLSDGTVTLTLSIPAGFSADDATFQIKRLISSALITALGTPSGRSLVGSNTFEFLSLSDVSTRNTSFLSPLTITMSYASADIEGLDISTLKIYRWTGTAWQELSGCTVNASSRTVSCTTTNFSAFGLFGQQASVRRQSSSGSRARSSQPVVAPAAPAGTPPPAAPAMAPLPAGAESLTFGASSPAVKTLQQFLNAQGFTVALSGPGSSGKETTYFGPATRAALEKYRAALAISQAPAAPGLAKFTKTLRLGMTDAAVKTLQQFLNAQGFTVALSGPGSSGKETTYFGPGTRQALVHFQQKNGLVGDGILGPATRVFISGAR